jgi:hypothetical protein
MSRHPVEHLIVHDEATAASAQGRRRLLVNGTSQPKHRSAMPVDSPAIEPPMTTTLGSCDFGIGARDDG